jgi:hypothetical protein
MGSKNKNVSNTWTANQQGTQQKGTQQTSNTNYTNKTVGNTASTGKSTVTGKVSTTARTPVINAGARNNILAQMKQRALQKMMQTRQKTASTGTAAKKR